MPFNNHVTLNKDCQFGPTMKLSKLSPMAKPWPKLHSVGQKIQHFFSVVKPSTKDTKYIQVGIIKKHLRANVLLFQDKRQSDDARERMKCWCKVTVVFFSRAYLFPASRSCSHSLSLFAADKSSIVRLRVNCCFRADDRQLTPGQRSVLSGAWCSDLKQYRWTEGLLTSSSGIFFIKTSGYVYNHYLCGSVS